MKKILILGNNNAVTYKEVFPLIKDGKLRIGWTKTQKFTNTDKKVQTYWYTSMKTGKKKILKASKLYDAKNYPKYDNYDAIECGRLKDFPVDYDGVIGVPITILEYVDDDGYINVEYDDKKFCPEQFEIVDINPHFFSMIEKGLPKPKQLTITGRKDPYARILIRHKK